MQLQFIKPQEIDAYLAKGAQFIDLRDRESYNRHHIQGAVSIPYEQFEQSMLRLSKYKVYVLYCEHGTTSLKALKRMLSKGYQGYTLGGGVARLFGDGKK